MSWRPPGDEEEDEEGGLEDVEVFGDIEADTVQFTKRDSIIFLIDYQKPMHVKKNKDTPSFFQRAVALAAKVIKDKIIASEDDYIGICFYGTEHRKNSADFPEIYVWGEMDVPDAPRIKELEEMAGMDRFDLIGKPGDGKVNFQHVLWACSNMFSKSAAKDDAKKVYIFTNNDDPIRGDGTLRTQARQKAQDMAELDVAIELFPQSQGDAPFNFHKFFQHIVTAVDADAEEDDAGFDPEARLSSLEDMVARKKHKRRSQGKVKLDLGNGVELGIKLFCMVRVAAKQKFELLDKRNNGTIQVNTTWVCNDTGQLLQPTEIQPYAKFSETERVCFSREELVEIKQPCDAGIRLLGFKPRASLQSYHNIRPSSFIYPAEELVRGSNPAFVALLEKCLEFDRIMIVRVTPRKNTSPRLAALVPQAENLDAEIPIPGGFQLLWLPYADDIRTVVAPAPSSVSRDAVEAAKALVTGLTIEFSSTDFDNPALEQHYATLQALALNEDTIPAVTDVVVPDTDGIAAHADTILAFREAAYPAGYSEPSDAPKKTTGVKRVKPEVSSEAAAAVAAEDWADLIRTNKIAKKTIPDLKNYLTANGLKVSGKKDELIARIKEHLGI